MGHINVRSIFTGFLDLQNTSEDDFDIFAVSETTDLSNDILYNYINTQKHTFFRKNCQSSKRGDSLLYHFFILKFLKLTQGIIQAWNICGIKFKKYVRNVIYNFCSASNSILKKVTDKKRESELKNDKKMFYTLGNMKSTIFLQKLTKFWKYCNNWYTFQHTLIK